MTKTCDYYITGVWKDSNKRVTDVMLHEVAENGGVRRGAKKSRAVVVDLIEKKHIIKTLVWDYSNTPNWRFGAVVGIDTVNSIKYLRTHPNSSGQDNIDNLIAMSYFAD